MAGLAKLQGPSWWNGTAIWKTMATGEFVVLDFTALAAWPLLVNLLTHASLALELLYPVLIWVKIVRPLLLAGVVAMHRGDRRDEPGPDRIRPGDARGEPGVCLRARGCVAWPLGRVSRRSQVLYDGACPRCRASMALITAADPDHVVEPVDLTAVDVSKVHPGLTREDCMRSMHAVSRYGPDHGRV